VPAGRRAVAEECAASVQHAVDALRRLMVQIYPPDLSGPGLPAALEDLAAPLRAAGTQVQITVGALPAMAPEVTATLYRVARETLANVAKHAAATAVRVELRSDGTDVVLRVADNGRGLPPGALDQRGEHLGVRLLTDRAQDLGGQFTLGAAAGGGTLAEAVIPAGQAG
jgi:signal transduction histidine kinase